MRAAGLASIIVVGACATSLAAQPSWLGDLFGARHVVHQRHRAAPKPASKPATRAPAPTGPAAAERKTSSNPPVPLPEPRPAEAPVNAPPPVPAPAPSANPDTATTLPATSQTSVSPARQQNSALAPSPTAVDDTVLPFEVAKLDLRGRVVRLGPVVDEILEKHAYPQPVAKLLGEAIVLTVMLGSALKIEGRFILQTQTDGPVRMLVVDFTVPGKVRGCARYDKTRIAEAIASGATGAGVLLGQGHLAMTIDQGPDTSRYQGLVALDGGTLEDAAHEYFLRSEQIPTRVRLAVAEELRPAQGGAKHRWRAGGIMLQFLPKSPERARVADLDPGDVPEGMTPDVVEEDVAWAEGRALVSTVEDLELIDPSLSSERLVYRLFHEPGVRVFQPGDIRAECSCSRETVESMLKNFSQDDRDHMVEDGKISVTCEFCSANYQFAPGDVGAGEE